MSRIIDAKLLKFILVGVVNTLIGMAIMFCLYNIFGCSYWASSAANYILVSILSYILNKKFTFGHQGEVVKSGLKFVLNIVICYSIAYGAAKPLVIWIMDGSSLYLQENVAMLVGMCIFTGLNYLGQKFFVFGETVMQHESNYNRWMRSQYITEKEKSELSAMTKEEIYEAFCKNIEFGTAGMRGIMGPGTNRINKYTVRMAAKGLADLLGEHSAVAIAYDTRNNSKAFAEEAAKVLAAAAIKVFLFDRYSPVPLLSFAVRELGCDSGIVITASHNSKEYNGFKVYDSTGSQMMPEPAGKIADNIDKLEDDLDIPVCDISNSNIMTIGDEITEKYLSAIKKCAVHTEPKDNKDLKIIYTPIHGSGRDFVLAALKQSGFGGVTLVQEQAGFNGDFPTVKKPNPEDPDVFKLAHARAFSDEVDILIGTDPDCDRIGVGVKHEDEIVYLTGNQIGALLIDFLACLKDKTDKKLITTIVTGDMGAAIAAAHGIEVQRTLTGFKYIGDIMNRMADKEFFMGYEESYGYLVGTHVRDKDGVSAALLICQMAAYYKAKGMTLINVLDMLYENHGYLMDKQDSFEFEGSEGIEKIKRIMNNLKHKEKDAFSKVGEVTYVLDYNKGIDGLHSANVLKYVFKDGSWIAIRPSGTEPKIKFYYCIRGENKDIAEKIYSSMKENTAMIIDRV